MLAQQVLLPTEPSRRALNPNLVVSYNVLRKVREDFIFTTNHTNIQNNNRESLFIHQYSSSGREIKILTFVIRPWCRFVPRQWPASLFLEKKVGEALGPGRWTYFDIGALSLQQLTDHLAQLIRI